MNNTSHLDPIDPTYQMRDFFRKQVIVKPSAQIILRLLEVGIIISFHVGSRDYVVENPKSKAFETRRTNTDDCK